GPTHHQKQHATKIVVFLHLFPPAREADSLPFVGTVSSVAIEICFMKNPGPQSATGKGWDRRRQPPQRPAAAKRNCRNCHKPGPPGCSKTMLNGRERPILGHASQSDVYAARSAASQLGCGLPWSRRRWRG